MGYLFIILYLNNPVLSEINLSKYIMSIITINPVQILLDKAMKQYLIRECGFTNSDLKTRGLKPLPPRLDTVVGNLKPEKIAHIQRAYDSGTNASLPLPHVNKLTESYYSVQDGRHRIVMAICNRIPTINVNVLNQSNDNKRRSKSRSKSRSRSRSKGGRIYRLNRKMRTGKKIRRR